MSVSTLIALHGKSVDVARPTNTIRDNGAMQRSYTTALSAVRCFVQPRTASDVEFAGGSRTRVGATFYFAGVVDIQADDVISDEDTKQYWVRSVRVPIQRPTASANCHTIVEAEHVVGETVFVL